MTRREAPISPPVVLTIAGSDSGGGAGIQADLKTIEACGGFGTSAITSVTAQNTQGVEGSHLLPTDDIDAQIEAVLSDFDVAAVKTGMLAASEVIDCVHSHADDLPNLVVDPVMVAASGDRLLAEDAEAAYESLVAEATLVTPNADEAEVLTGVAIEGPESAERAGRVLVEEQGADAALVKGGHVPGDQVVDTLVVAEDAGSSVTTVRHDRVDTVATHGSGCTLSSAIATRLAHGDDVQTAVARGIDLLARAVRYPIDVGEGPGAVHHLVNLRNDVSRAPTAERLSGLARRLRDAESTVESLAPAGGLGLVAATPHAEEPADVAGVLGRLSPATDGIAVGYGADDVLASVLLAAREVDPALRFGALVAGDGDAVDDLDGPALAVEGLGAHLESPGPVPAAVLDPIPAASTAPVAIETASASTDGEVSLLVLLAETAETLGERVTGLANGTV